MSYQEIFLSMSSDDKLKVMNALTKLNEENECTGFDLINSAIDKVLDN